MAVKGSGSCKSRAASSLKQVVGKRLYPLTAAVAQIAEREVSHCLSDGAERDNGQSSQTLTVNVPSCMKAMQGGSKFNMCWLR